MAPVDASSVDKMRRLFVTCYCYVAMSFAQHRVHLTTVHWTARDWPDYCA